MTEMLLKRVQSKKKYSESPDQEITGYKSPVTLQIRLVFTSGGKMGVFTVASEKKVR